MCNSQLSLGHLHTAFSGELDLGINECDNSKTYITPTNDKLSPVQRPLDIRTDYFLVISPS